VPDLEFLSRLEAVIAERLRDPPPGSYTAELAAAGVAQIARKVGEEGVELAVAGVTEDDARVREEAADVIYHLMLMLAVRGLSLGDVVAELERRHRPG
jgi:phosphoribosyl-ATP pyrophosphohydrolase/phosphoribosyl-AMP cyclohydrolase